MKTVLICEDCKKEINLEVDEIVTKATSSLVGLYYKGDGVCRTCLEGYYEEAHIKYEAEAQNEKM